MPRIRFLGDSGTTRWLGVDFIHGQWVDRHRLDAEQLARVDAHPHFEVEGAAAKPAPKPKA